MNLIQFGHDGGGKRDFLNDRPIYCASSLEVLRGDQWVPVRYEISGYHAEPMQVKLYRDGDTEQTAIILDRENDWVRWPKKGDS